MPHRNRDDTIAQLIDQRASREGAKARKVKMILLFFAFFAASRAPSHHASKALKTSFDPDGGWR
jgi:hypothetical protein